MKNFDWNTLTQSERKECLSRPTTQNDQNITSSTRQIVEDVKANGDKAVKSYTKRFDKVELNNLKVSKEEMKHASSTIAQDKKQAIEIAYNNITLFHKNQGLRAFSENISNDIQCERRVVPLESVGLYVPGGTAPLVSTALMNGIPSQIAGCKNRIMCTPCDKNGGINPHILYAAQLCGIATIFKVGGAQAIAAMAYGTETIPSVDKIFGPGNTYVTSAKKIVSECPNGAALDMPAGPSEVCVIADDTTNPIFAAADLLSQAEHDPLSQAVLISTSTHMRDNVLKEIENQRKALSRTAIIEQSLEKSISIIAEDMTQAIEIANAYAAEHLILCFDNAEQYVDQIIHAGSIFVGPWSPESAGDYCSGTNHVLPTYGYAKNYSGLSVEAFQKTITVQKLSRKGLESLSRTIIDIANLEGLDAHANAVSLRLKD
ncbi:MAG: histidinol dehydrogenase [Alphaproteobacteria bacterium]|nr:histidinol dehydrogenase [Alphaproteobacteria bacterium]